MIRRPPRSTRTDTLFPYTTLFRSLLARGERQFGVLAIGDILDGADCADRPAGWTLAGEKNVRAQLYPPDLAVWSNHTIIECISASAFRIAGKLGCRAYARQILRVDEQIGRASWRERGGQYV